MTGKLRDRVGTLGGPDGRHAIYFHRWSGLGG